MRGDGEGCSSGSRDAKLFRCERAVHGSGDGFGLAVRAPAEARRRGGAEAGNLGNDGRATAGRARHLDDLPLIGDPGFVFRRGLGTGNDGLRHLPALVRGLRVLQHGERGLDLLLCDRRPTLRRREPALTLGRALGLRHLLLRCLRTDHVRLLLMQRLSVCGRLVGRPEYAKVASRLAE